MRRYLALAAALVVALIAAIVLFTGEDDSAPSVPSVVHVDGPDRDVEPDVKVELDDRAQDVYEQVSDAPERHDLAGGLRGDDRTPVAEHEGPLATPSFPGCDTRILQANWSNRTSAVQAVALHYTAGGNRAGRSDMDGLTAYANSPSAGVSWHFLIDAEGHCYYSVPLAKKAWTIGNLNSQTVNIEVIGTGREGSYPAGSAGARKLASVVQRLGRIYGIPMRVGAVSSCRVTKPGVITHWQGGACSGGHVDIRPYDLGRVVARIAAQGGTAPSAVVTWCRKLEWYRARVRADRPTTAEMRRNARLRKRLVARRGWRCTRSGPVRA